MLSLFVAAAVTFLVPEEEATLERDVTAVYTSCNGEVDTTIGFAFASMALSPEDGEDSAIVSSRAKIFAAAQLLAAHPKATVDIEGHVGVSAPPEIAESYSEQRAVVHLQLPQMPKISR